MNRGMCDVDCGAQIFCFVAFFAISKFYKLVEQVHIKVIENFHMVKSKAFEYAIVVVTHSIVLIRHSESRYLKSDIASCQQMINRIDSG